MTSTRRPANTPRDSFHSEYGQSRGAGPRTRESARPSSQRPDEGARNPSRTRECRPAGTPPSIAPGTGRGRSSGGAVGGRSRADPSLEQNVRVGRNCELPAVRISRVVSELIRLHTTVRLKCPSTFQPPGKLSSTQEIASSGWREDPVHILPPTPMELSPAYASSSDEVP
jgi:hypothetical protein